MSFNFSSRKDLLEYTLSKLSDYQNAAIDDKIEGCRHLPRELEQLLDLIQYNNPNALNSYQSSSRYHYNLNYFISMVTERLNRFDRFSRQVEAILKSAATINSRIFQYFAELKFLIVESASVNDSLAEGLLGVGEGILLGDFDDKCFKSYTKIGLFLLEESLRVAQEQNNDLSAKRAAFKLAQFYSGALMHRDDLYLFPHDEQKAVHYLIIAESHGSSTANYYLNQDNPIIELVEDSLANVEDFPASTKSLLNTKKSKMSVHKSLVSNGVFKNARQKKSSFRAACQLDSREEYIEAVTRVLKGI